MASASVFLESCITSSSMVSTPVLPLFFSCLSKPGGGGAAAAPGSCCTSAPALPLAANRSSCVFAYTTCNLVMALARIAWVCRWSLMVAWKSAFSDSRFWPACLICNLTSAICLFKSSISDVSLAMRLSRSSILFSNSDFCLLAAAVSFSLVLNSETQKSRCFTSSACSCLSSLIIFSHASLIFVKVSKLTVPASLSRSAFPVLFAAANSNPATRPRASRLRAAVRLAPTCSKLSARPIVSDPESSVKILIASCTAESSALLSATR
mmetsp:Transcript_17321/g.41697  ORF Transcript_17321/g.41697 Transcript_17321/m.41697 type:complete len:266 (-) Transcript_17321:962-1759(-)